MKILAFPKDANPYQELLYGPMPASVQVTYISKPYNKLTLLFYPLYVFINLFIRRLMGYQILHIHWLYPLTVPAAIPYSKHINMAYALVFLKTIKLLRYKVVWTVHNVLPHNPITTNDLKIRRRLADIASAKIVHNQYTLELLHEKYINSDRSHVIGIGSYEGQYENTVTREEARNFFHLDSSVHVILFFGVIGQQKNVPHLLEVFEQLLLDDPSVHLIVAGKCYDAGLLKQITPYFKKYGKNFLFFNEYIKDDNIQYYFNAADVVAFPFKEITTTSSVLLAAAFGKPIVAPLIGATRELPKDIGIFYNPNPSQRNALYDSLTAALKSSTRRKRMGKFARLYSQDVQWDKIAVRTLNVYKSLI